MLRWIDGFDRTDYNGVRLKYANDGSAGGGGGGAIVTGRNSQGAFQIFNTGFGSSYRTKILDAQSKWICGFDFALSGSGGGAPAVKWYGIGTSVGTILELKTRTDQKMDLVQGSMCTSPGQIIATTQNPFAVGAWQYLELVATFGTRIGYALFSEGEPVKNSAGVDFADSNLSLGVSALPDRHRFGWANLGFRGFNIDNYYIADGQDNGDGMTDRLGPSTVTGLSPISDDTAQWSSNIAGAKYLAIRDNFWDNPVTVHAPDGDATYLLPNSGAGDLALFNLEESPCFGLVLAVALNCVLKPIPAAASIELDIKMRQGLQNLGAFLFQRAGAYANIASQYTDYGTVQALSSSNPVTGEAWNDSVISSNPWGIRCVSAGADMRATQVYVEKLTTRDTSRKYTCGGLSNYSR